MFLSQSSNVLSKALNPIRVNRGALYITSSRLMASEAGSGEGRGGGSGGSIRSAGGAMGKKGTAEEEMYFSKQSNEMKHKLKSHLQDEIKKHEDAIKKSKELLKEVEK